MPRHSWWGYSLILALVIPSIILPFLNNSNFTMGVMDYILIFFVYLGLAFIATFFNVCTVFTVKTRLQGGNATFMDSINFGFSKIYVIFLWSLLSASVGVLLRVLDELSKRLGSGGRIISQILISMLGMAWGILTLFVVPSLVYKGLNPFDAIRDSTKTLKKTWGESLIRHFGLGLMEFLFLFLGIIVLVFLTVFSFNISQSLGVIFLLFVIIYIVLVILSFHVANTVFNTILYEYALSGKVLEEVDEHILKDAFVTKK